MRRFLRRLRWFAGCIAALILLWLGGLAWFVYDGRRTTDDSAAPTDAIVVLTGGRFRLESGLDLLEEGKAHKLFVSGVNQRVDREALLRLFGPVPNWASCCIVLGHDADNTFGNARETADWMRREGYRSLRLVTSWYHMPRSRLEFARAMPEVTLRTHPVFPPHPNEANWDDRTHAAALVIGEYHKYLASLLRPLVGPLAPYLQRLIPADAGGETFAAKNFPPTGSSLPAKPQ
jgi:uncharacterized SAM-binding protein YcdF (DUF218 family)